MARGGILRGPPTRGHRDTPFFPPFFFLKKKSCEHVFVSIEGHPSAWLRSSLDRGDLPGARAAASEMERISLTDALRMLALIAEKQPGI